eukprot:gene7077-14391_t
MAQLLIYGSRTDCSLLSNYLRLFEKFRTGSSTDLEIEQSFEADQSSINIVHFETKYYTADCKTVIFELGLPNLSPLSPEILERLECCILLPSKDVVVDEELQKLDIEVELQFLITLTEGSDKISSTLREERILWTINHNFEHIEIDTSNLLSGWEEREKEGLPRLIEALQSHMWSTMKRTTDKKRSDRREPDVISATTVTGSECDLSEKKTNTTTVEADNSSKTTATNDIGGTGSISSRTAESQSQGNNGIIVDSIFTFPVHNTETVPSAVEPKDATDNDDVESKVSVLKDFMDRDSDEEDDEIWGGLANFISQAKSLRTDAMLGSVSDDDRRDRAAKLASRLANMLALDESEDED